MRIVATQPAVHDLAVVFGAAGLSDGMASPVWDEIEAAPGAFDLAGFLATVDAMPDHLGIVIAPTGGARAPAWLATLPDARIARNIFISPAYHHPPRSMDVTAPYTPGYVTAYLAMHQALHDALSQSQLARVTEVKPTAFAWFDNELQIPWCSGKTANARNNEIWTALDFIPENVLDTYLYILEELRAIWGPAVSLAQSSWKPDYFLPCSGTEQQTAALWQTWLQAATAAQPPYQIIDTALGPASINPAFLTAQAAGVALAFQTQAGLGSKHAILDAVTNGLAHAPTALELHAADIARWPGLPAAIHAPA